tara:strand:- start:998 stop:1261 length:264 start_codon:yes stop_codon:yes gene_type:complete
MEQNQEKLSNEELSELRSHHDNYNSSKDNLALIEVRISRLKNQKVLGLEMFEKTEASLDGYESELRETYGEGISINLGDGAITRSAD